MPPLTDTFDAALDYALAAHRDQSRKGGDVPYAAHLLAVAALVLEAGADETTAVVALLHDVVEDQGEEHLEAIRARFGDVVAEAVQECSAEAKTDTTEWMPRKLRYVEQMQIASLVAVRVSVADKLHNLRSTLADYRATGEAVFARFNAPDGDAVVWYYRRLVDVYGERLGMFDPQVNELSRTVGQLELLRHRPDCPRCGAGDVLPVLMGLPDLEGMAWADAGHAVIGGCIVSDDSPDWECQACGHDWPDPMREHAR